MKKGIVRKLLSLLFVFSLIVPTTLLNFVPAASAAEATAEQTSYITVAEAIANNTGKATVQGYIVGTTKSGTSYDQESPFDINTNLGLADDQNETDPAKILPVQLPKGDVRTGINLVDHPDNFKRKVAITGSLEAYFSVPGLKSASSYEFLDGDSNPGEPDPEPEQPTVITIAEARTQGTGQAAVKGIVTALLKNTIHIQDETAAIAVRPTSLDVQLGDEITVSGSLQDYRGLLQLDSATLIEKTEDKGVPSPAELVGAKVNEENESKLALVKNVELIDVNKGNGWANYTAKAEDGTEFLVRDENGTLELSVGTTYESITGIVQQFDQDYQIIPRGQADIIEDTSKVQPVSASQPSGTIPAGTQVTLSTSTADAEIYFTTDGTEPTVENGQKYSEPITVDEDVTIKAIAVKAGLTTSEVKEFTYSVYDAADIKIHDIQSESHNSPLDGVVVNNVEGVVTYIYSIKGGNYFHMQTPDDQKDDNANTSEGIVVYTGNKANVKVGNLVTVTGTVDEYHIDGYSDANKSDLAVTQINARDDRGGVVTVIEEEVALPTTVKLTNENLPNQVIDNDSFAKFDPEEDAIDFWESIEGMLVEVGTVKAVAPQEHGDLITVLENRKTDTLHGGVLLTEDNANPDRIQFKMYDNNAARDFEVATGDKFTGPITGVVNYGFQNYKIYVDLDDMESNHVKGNAEPETTTIVKEDDKLTIASYNLENFSNNTKETSDDKAQKLARAFVQDMKSPDIIGVTEVQDNNGQSAGDSAANESYERLIEAIVAAGGPEYQYLNIDPVNNQDGGAPNANIRVGFLYNPERVSLPEGIQAGDATTAVGYEDGKLTHNPGRIDPTNAAFDNSRKPLAAQFTFKGEDVVVIVNHWNSKSGDTPLFGSTQPPVYGSEVQRKQIANIVYDFIEEIKVDNPDANVVSVGDFNDYQFAESLKIHEGDLMTNMINHVGKSDRYTYLFQGNSQVLDHILVSNNLVPGTEIDILHINADFTDMAGRASDHDPVMVQVDLKANYDLTIMHTNDTHASLDNMPKTVTAVKEVRAENPDSLLLHAGDAFTGTLYFNEFQGEADLAMMNLMGLDAMTFGNHEFDLGSSSEGHQKLVEFIQGAQFPFVSANVDFSKDAKFDGIFNDSIASDIENGQIYNGIIKEVNGEKVGIFGLTTEETSDISSPGSIEFENYLDEARKAVEAFEAQEVNKIIALTHIGYDDNAAVDNDLILAEQVEGIDVIVGGHSHTELAEPVVVAKDETPTVIVQTGNANSNLGVLNVEFDENGVVETHNGKLIEIKGQDPDEEAQAVLAPYKAKVEEVANTEIGVSTPIELENPRTSGDDTKPSVRKNETILGNLITDGMLEKAKLFTGKDVIMALQNGGGIRAAIDAGPITTGEVITVLPFGNTLATMDVTGAELKEAFEISVSKYPGENGGFLHLAGGKVKFDSTKPEHERVVSVSYLNENGEYIEVQDDKLYTIATNAFTAKGGDGYDVFAKAYEDGRVTDLGLSDWENFRDHLVSLGSEGIPTEVEGRIVDVEGQFNLTVLHTNDTHAALDKMPKTVTAVKDERAKDPNALLLHAGDAFTGTLYFNEFLGKADLAMMNLMGFDAMTFGNHEFDLGSSSEGHQKLVEFIKGAKFPFVSANVDFSKDAKFDGIFNDSIASEIDNGQIYNGIIKEINGEKVGIFGLTTEETADISSPGSIAFENYLQEAEKAVEAFEAEGVNKIIALTHIGYDDNAAVDNDLILAEKVEGIDVIVGGHSHTALDVPSVVAKDKTPTVIVQTGNANSNLGVLDVVFDEKGVVIEHAGELISIGDQEADPEAAEVLAPYKAQVDKVAQEKIGVSTPIELAYPRTNGDNTKPSVRKNETILGNLITDGMLKKAREFTGENVVMALQNGGGIRAAINEGPITVGEVITVLPFGNTLATMELTGAELKEAFEISVSKYPDENGGFLHVAGGKVEFDSSKPAGERVIAVFIEDANGNLVAVDDNTTYIIATNAFTAKGGDGYDVFAKAYEEGRVTDLGLSDWENFREHLVSLGSEGIPTETEGRIVDVTTTPGEEEPQIIVVTPEVERGNKYVVSPDDLGELKEGAIVRVEVPEKKNTIFVSLSSEAIAKLKAANATLVISNSVVDLQIPSSILPDSETEIKVQKDNRKDALVAYDFTIKSEGKGYHKFNEKVTMTFSIDPKTVDDPKKVKVFYWNPQSKEWELVGGEYKDGKITATTDHFSTFGVLEIEDTKESPGTEVKDSDTNESTEKDSDSKNSNGGKKLPITATNMANMLVVGLSLILVAVGLLYVNRRKTA
ncbi:5'-nucleotidase C-terminal domain-containing protein [Fredinandcohnia onubensis]|uniref:5'-nucleotidase C-terminal domain-containing protein n=1 Tax=Fredinandcohnia onubensis TaxID=1571209 RepID=UPI00211EA819|nr:5'-nucleotidase C-terminal domain-containing protein [Fredinandcohnia onubensis]